MAVRRPPATAVDLDLEAPPPGWVAHHVWSRRWALEYRPPLPRNRAQAYRTILNAGPAEPHVAAARRRWAALPAESRRRWWEYEPERRGEGCAPCPRHDQAVALCPQDCTEVARLQAEHDRENQHYWTPGAAG